VADVDRLIVRGVREFSAEVERLGHVVLGTNRFRGAVDCCLDTLGLIVSDFLCLDGQRDRGPVMAFIRCDQEACPPTTCILAMALQPRAGLHGFPQAIMFHQVVAAVDSHARLPQLAWSIPAGLVALTSRVAAALVIVVARKRRLASARGDLR
jgi:hypothetical protein